MFVYFRVSAVSRLLSAKEYLIFIMRACFVEWAEYVKSIWGVSRSDLLNSELDFISQRYSCFVAM